MFQASRIRFPVLLPVIFVLLFNTPTALSLSCSNNSLTLAETNNAQHHPQSLRPQETSLQVRMPLPHAHVNWHFGFNDRRIALFDPAVVVGVSVIVACLVILVRLFSNILDSCLDLWAYSPPANQVVIEAGKMRLEFGCSMKPVPWEFIAEYAASRKDATERGFAPGFAKEWWYDNHNRRRLCYAGIRVVPDGGEVTRPGKLA